MMMDWSSGRDEGSACRVWSGDEDQEQDNGLHFEKGVHR